MDFAKKQLEKYGWEEGKGLGKHENGISTALKPKLKFDNAGVGHEAGKDFTNNWWENVYNKASKNIQVSKEDDNIKMKLVNVESVEITTKNYSVRDFKKNNLMEYGSFLKTARLTEDGVVNYDNVAAPESTFNMRTLTDDELLAACEGRTAHKGARHGLKLSGKLSRIEKQEKILLKKLQNISITDGDNTKTEKKIKKLLKTKSKVENKEAPIESPTKKKKRKKKRKSVSFSETVTEYHTQDLDTSTQSNESLEEPVIVHTKIKDKNDETCPLDEGIEQDCEMKSLDLGQQSFEEVQTVKKKKKKPKKPEDSVDEASDHCKRKYQEDEIAAIIINKKLCEDISTKSIKKKKKKKRRAEKVMNSIADSLDQVCKISDTE